MAERKFPPYVNAHGGVASLFPKIREAQVPTKFTNDFLASMLGLKSSSHRALIPLLKKIDFLDAAGVPTVAYKDYRGEQGKSAILADKLRKAYADLYKASEYAHRQDKKELENIIVRITGASKSDQQVSAVASTFLELVKLADFEGEVPPPHLIQEEEPRNEVRKDREQVHVELPTKFGLSYTINLNLPPTTEIEVFNAIFKSLKANLLDK